MSYSYNSQEGGFAASSSASATQNIASDLLHLLGNSAVSSGTMVGTASFGSALSGSAATYELGLGSASVSINHNSSAAASSAVSAQFLSQIETAILRSQIPIEINETEEITVLGERGIWANRAEVVEWRGVIPINQYVINEDQNPEIITKKSSQQLEYVQELAIRYLRPPTPPTPGEIIITQEANTAVAPAPPLIIRQQPARAETPEPLVILIKTQI
jgi:hypothetical protein